jgi:hypothetical protein
MLGLLFALTCIPSHFNILTRNFDLPGCGSRVAIDASWTRAMGVSNGPEHDRYTFEGEVTASSQTVHTLIIQRSRYEVLNVEA